MVWNLTFVPNSTCLVSKFAKFLFVFDLGLVGWFGSSECGCGVFWACYKTKFLVVLVFWTEICVV